MKIPEKIRIGGIDYEIKSVEGLNDGEKVLYGEVDYGHSVIKLNLENQSHQFRSVTLWHELLHAVATQANLDLGEDAERIIDIFAFGIYQILQDNGRALFDIVESGDAVD